jgi:O-6-methylguanine DNA methyltransferase
MNTASSASTAVRKLEKHGRHSSTPQAVATLRVPIETAIGTFLAHYGRAGLCGLDFPTRSGRAASGDAASNVTPEIARWHETTTSALRSVLDGCQPDKLPPMDLSSGTAFQKSVWRAMLEISCGKTKSYSEIASAISRPRAVRAVGAACGANPIPVLIPCHRVLAANKKIGGFSAGLDWKRKLLAIESPGLFD